MKPPSEAVSVELDVPFHDVDAMRIVWHGNYYKYLEHARTALFVSKNLDVEQVLETGYGLVVIETRCRHVAPLRYRDRIRVSAWFRDTENRVRIDYEVWNITTNRRAAKASTILATVDQNGDLMLRTPDAIRDRLLA